MTHIILKLKGFIKSFLILSMILSIQSIYSQNIEFDKNVFSVTPDFYAINEDGVNIAYRFYENVIALENNNVVCYDVLSYDGYQRYPDKFGIEKTDKLMVMYDYNSIKSKNKNYNGNKIIRIPQKVEFEGKFYEVIAISHGAFKNCQDVEEIILPNSVKMIYIGAFSYCNKLKNVQFPEKVIYLDEFLFEGSNSIEEVILPSLDKRYFKNMKISLLDRNNSIKKIEIDSTWSNSNIFNLNAGVSSRFRRINFHHKSDEEINEMDIDFTGVYPFEIRYRY